MKLEDSPLQNTAKPETDFSSSKNFAYIPSQISVKPATQAEQEPEEMYELIETPPTSKNRYEPMRASQRGTSKNATESGAKGEEGSATPEKKQEYDNIN